MLKEFNQNYYLEQLSHFHRLFYAVFELGQPIYNTQIDTAAVGLNMGTGKINFLLNPDFFYKLGESEQLFILCHEAMHVLLYHIDRSLQYDLDSELANIAQDIVINETLVTEFGFHRELLNFGITLCFIDTVFNAEQIAKHNIVSGKSFEFYYDLLVKYKESIPKIVVTLDFHISGSGDLVLKDQDGNLIVDIPPEIASQVLDKVGHQLNREELESLLEAFKDSYGGTAGLDNVLNVELIEKKKRPWEGLVKNKIATLQKNKEKRLETFKFRPRRIINLSEDLYLPEIVIDETKENDKFNIVFFIDASGSCIDYRSKFFNLVKTIPEDKFNIHLYSFDTKTYLLDIDKCVVKGSGGTAFKPLEDTVQDLVGNDNDFKGKYPDLVFVLSDGDGNNFMPQKPERWYFLLTKNSTQYIPKSSNIVLINNFVRGNTKSTIKKLSCL